MKCEIRREQTEHELDELSRIIKKWLAYRRLADRDENNIYVGRHETQLRAIESLLEEALNALTENLPNPGFDEETGAFYDLCREVDESILWVRRVWEFYRSKFDQRDDREKLGPLLKAADEVVWSCYHPLFDLARARKPALIEGPAPLCYIDPQYSPAAIQSDAALPSDLQLMTDLRFLDKFLKSLPVPLLRLPPWCQDAPWWLVYVAHEVGHHVQHDLELIRPFRFGMEYAAAARGLSKDEIQLWGKWGEEIFADIFSVLRMGTWAVWAIAEAERGSPQRMTRRKKLYPAPVIRLILMVEAASRLNIDVTGVLSTESLRQLAESDSQSKRDLAVVQGAVVFALEDKLDGIGPLPGLCKGDSLGYRWSADEVEGWSRHLLKTGQMALDRKLGDACLITAASLAAWAGFANMNAQDRPAARDRLACATKETLIASAPPGTRAQYAPSGEIPDRGKELATRLLSRARRLRGHR